MGLVNIADPWAYSQAILRAFGRANLCEESTLGDRNYNLDAEVREFWHSQLLIYDDVSVDDMILLAAPQECINYVWFVQAIFLFCVALSRIKLTMYVHI
jgi:hypothetical protein